MPKRLLSLDVMRGLIMILLAAESTSLYSRLDKAAAGTWLQRVTEQFFHHDWHGLRFWDLIQPAFMTMAGAAMFLSFYFKEQKESNKLIEEFMLLANRTVAENVSKIQINKKALPFQQAQNGVNIKTNLSPIV